MLEIHTKFMNICIIKNKGNEEYKIILLITDFISKNHRKIIEKS
jgi:hypothetical protein